MARQVNITCGTTWNAPSERKEKQLRKLGKFESTTMVM